MVTIEDFWEIDDYIKNKWGSKAYNHIDYCGIEPVRPLQNYGYFCTPKNSLTFAATGGDGVHFGILQNDNNQQGPVIMTVPMAEINNIVVAENLEEFFSIGYHVGWFALEQLSYDPEEILEYFNQPDVELDEDQNRFLEIVRDKLRIQHIPLTTERLTTLKETYHHKFEIADIDDD